MVLSITLEKMVEAGEPYFLEASSASLTSSLLVHSGLCGSSRERPHTEGEKESSVQLTAANMHTEHRVTRGKRAGACSKPNLCVVGLCRFSTATSRPAGTAV